MIHWYWMIPAAIVGFFIGVIFTECVNNPRDY